MSHLYVVRNTDRPPKKKRKRDVLGVDLGLACLGLAVVRGKKLVYSDQFRTSSKHVLEDRLEAIVQEVLRLASNVDLTIIEGPAFNRPNAAIAMGQVSGVLRLDLYRRGFPFVIVAPPAVKKYATGKGNANKQEMMKAAAPWFMLQAITPDQADALWMALYGEENYDALVETVMRQEEEGGE